MAAKYMAIEMPDQKIKIDFLGGGEMQGCTVQLAHNGKNELHVRVMGCDDVATILLDSVIEIPNEDRRR